jgi:alpha-aminoadipate carrier protein LysW
LPDYKCQDCSADVQVSSDALDGEIVVCPDCGLELQVKKKTSGEVELTEVTKEKEDWGE